MSRRSMICRNLLKVDHAKIMIQTFVITARQRSRLMSWKQHMSTQDTKGQQIKYTIFFVIRKNILFISSFLNFCFSISVMEAKLKNRYYNVTRQVTDFYLALCEQCQLKKKTTKRGLVVRPILSHYINSWCQVDLTDMQYELDGYY